MSRQAWNRTPRLRIKGTAKKNQNAAAQRQAANEETIAQNTSHSTVRPPSASLRFPNINTIGSANTASAMTTWPSKVRHSQSTVRDFIDKGSRYLRVCGVSSGPIPDGRECPISGRLTLPLSGYALTPLLRRDQDVLFDDASVWIHGIGIDRRSSPCLVMKLRHARLRWRSEPDLWSDGSRRRRPHIVNDASKRPADCRSTKRRLETMVEVQAVANPHAERRDDNESQRS